MTTIPPEQAHDPAPGPREAHQAREVAESFGPEAGRYDRARPRYPRALIERIAAASPGRDVLDVGCGTGISSRQLQAAGCRVLGVDPDPRMAAFARQRGLEAEVAKFEEWDCAGRTFDAVTAGMTWHWVDPVAGAAKAARVLRPGGRLAVFWYVFQPPAALGEAFDDAYRRVLPPGSPFAAAGTMPGLDAYSAFFTKAEEGIRASGAFGAPEPWQQWRYDWDQRYTRDQWLDMVPTAGGHSTFPPAVLQQLLDSIGAAIDAHGGSFTMHCTAAAVTATRSGSGSGDE
jgi:ubiquinone/menaquinone biosynthesis C-methylase UbiE